MNLTQQGMFSSTLGRLCTLHIRVCTIRQRPKRSTHEIGLFCVRMGLESSISLTCPNLKISCTHCNISLARTVSCVLSSGATAPSEPAETPPVQVYVPKVPYPIPPKHLMDPISEEQLAGETREEIKALFTEALTPSLKVLPKVDDPGNFVFPSFIAGVEFKEALCDSGSSENIVSKAIVDELGIADVEPSQVKLAFANSSMAVPYGTIHNLRVQVGDCVLHTEFQVVEMRKDHEMPLIFGRSFMATVGAIIDMPNKRVSFSNINNKVFYKVVPTRSQIHYASFISVVSGEQLEIVPKKELGKKGEMK
ncbi:hypothetical protein F2Q69_00048035 [Brassica cretica]|uniref:Aspartic peptidase DDI1-type domain-containing protein n=1 Tax=Brassica cretica TaxID=69181 RepID=A0A8S9PST8_BRACR|nr:hypothetical protein F2Q69_00048035 [Brassica cretica]